MRFTPTPVFGAFLVDMDMHSDQRGSFGRIYCPQEFAQAGINFSVAQANLSRNAARHTLRGLHVQAPPIAEAKLIRCTSGRIFDVAVDIRPDSPTRGQHAYVELSADEDRLFYIPAGCAHGFLTLEPQTDLLYLMGAAYLSGFDQGLRWDDPQFSIAWPAQPTVISERDASYPDFPGFV